MAHQLAEGEGREALDRGRHQAYALGHERGVEKMSESVSRKIAWIVVGGIIGGAISLTYKTWIEPMFAARPVIEFRASSDEAWRADFVISNNGDAVAQNVSAAIWATSAFASQTDVIDVVHTGGASDATCDSGLYRAKITGIRTSIPTQMNTEAQAALVQRDLIRPGERWSGSVRFEGPEAVFGLTAVVKDSTTSEIKYGRFADGER